MRQKEQWPLVTSVLQQQKLQKGKKILLRNKMENIMTSNLQKQL